MLLNKADQALIVDVLINEGKKTEDVTSALHWLELINKVKALEIEKPDPSYTMENVFTEMDKLGL